MLIDPPRRDGHDVRLHFVKHLPIVGERALDGQALGRRGQSHAIIVRHGDNLRAGNLAPHGVDRMAVIAAPRAPNDCHAKCIGHASTIPRR